MPYNAQIAATCAFLLPLRINGGIQDMRRVGAGCGVVKNILKKKRDKLACSK